MWGTVAGAQQHTMGSSTATVACESTFSSRLGAVRPNPKSRALPTSGRDGTPVMAELVPYGQARHGRV